MSLRRFHRSVSVAATACAGILLMTGFLLWASTIPRNIGAGTSESIPSNASSQPRDDSRIRLLGIEPGQTISYGDTITLHWSHYSGSEPLLLVLNSGGESYPIASNLPATPSGTFRWTIAEGAMGDGQLEIYPPGGRELFGRSNPFTLSGTSTVVLHTPLTNEIIDARHPAIVSGTYFPSDLHRSLHVQASYMIDQTSYWFDDAILLCDFNCPGPETKPVPFEFHINLQNLETCRFYLDFFEKNHLGQSFKVYALSVNVGNKDGCTAMEAFTHPPAQ